MDKCRGILCRCTSIGVCAILVTAICTLWECCRLVPPGEWVPRNLSTLWRCSSAKTRITWVNRCSRYSHCLKTYWNSLIFLRAKRAIFTLYSRKHKCFFKNRYGRNLEKWDIFQWFFKHCGLCSWIGSSSSYRTLRGGILHPLNDFPSGNDVNVWSFHHLGQEFAECSAIFLVFEPGGMEVKT